MMTMTVRTLWIACFLIFTAFAATALCSEEDQSKAAGKYITTSDGVRLYVEVTGQGTPCLYIHGGPGSGSYWMRKLSDGLLERHFQMIYLDQRGVARSTSPKDGNYGMDRLVKDFEEVREALGIKQWLTLGHSFGGILQMGYVQRHPESVKGMVMTNCALDLRSCLLDSWIPRAIGFLGTDEPLPSADSTAPALVERVGKLGKQLRGKDLFWKMAYASQASEALMNATFSDIPEWNNDFGNAAMQVKDYQEDFRKLTADVKVPVLFFYGKRDWMAGPKQYEGARFPELMLRSSDGGHVPVIENRTELEDAIAAYNAKYGF